MVWGAMIAIASIAKVEPEKVYEHVRLIREKIDTGSVITNVHGVYALINMAGSSEIIYRDIVDEILDILDKTRSVDFPKRCESIALIIKDEDKIKFKQVIKKNDDRISGAGKNRIDKILKKM